MNKDKILGLVKEYVNSRVKPEDTSVPVSSPYIDADDIANVVSAALDGWFTEKTLAKEFQQKLQNYIGLKNSILCNSGSSSILLAMSACKEVFPKRKYVLTSALAFPTTVFPIIQLGYVPLFVDVDTATLNPNPDEVLSVLDAYKNDIAGVILTHTLGFPIGKLFTIAVECEENGIFFIEDCCDALGSTYHGKHVGTFGDVMTLSFFPAHHITTGEGGAVLSKSLALMKEVRKFANWGRDCWCIPGDSNTCKRRFDWEFEGLPAGYDHKYTFTRLGYNLKMTELQAALGVSQMDKLEWFVQARKDRYWHLYVKLPKTSAFRFGVDFPHDASPSPFGFPITVVDTSIDTRKVIQRLEGANIRTRPIFAGNIIRQPVMKNVEYEVANYLDGANYVMERVFWIGCHPSLDIGQLNHVIEVFDDIEKNGV